MILDSMNNIARYYGLLPGLEEGVEFALTLKGKPTGRYDLGHGGIYCLVQEGDTSPYEEGHFEYHRKYVDVQILTDGAEVVGWQDTAALTEVYAEYDGTKDIAFLDGEGIPVLVKEGMFYLVFPEDSHMPCRHIQNKLHYNKLVLKVPCV